MLSVHTDDPESPEAMALIEELSQTLASITGETGASSFDASDVRGPRGRFVIARDADGHAVGCGALRPVTEQVAEIKRMFARRGTRGVGHAVLTHLELEAAALGYVETWLETGPSNTRAIAFYKAHGYRPIPRFGPYVDKPNAVCFAKSLTEPRAQAL